MSKEFKNPYEASSSRTPDLSEMEINDEDHHLDKVLDQILQSVEAIVQMLEIQSEALKFLCAKIPK